MGTMDPLLEHRIITVPRKTCNWESKFWMPTPQLRHQIDSKKKISYFLTTKFILGLLE